MVEDQQAAWEKMHRFISLDDVIPFNDWTNAQLTKSMNHDALKVRILVDLSFYVHALSYWF